MFWKNDEGGVQTAVLGLLENTFLRDTKYKLKSVVEAKLVETRGKMKLKANQMAVPFTVHDISGTPISLADYQGKKLLLSFYRYAACPFCNLRVHHLIEHYDNLQARGLNVLAFFQSPQAKILQYVTAKHDVPFPIVADPDHEVYKMYGLGASWWGYIRGAMKMGLLREASGIGLMENDPDGIKNLLPADFLIEPDQTIHTAFYGNDISEHIPFEQIDAFLEHKVAA